MKTLKARMLFVGLVLLALLSAPVGALGEEGVIVVGEGHSKSKSFGKVPFESKPTVTSSDPGVATATWVGEESGTLIISGVKEGTTEVTVKGTLRVVDLKSGELTVQAYSASVTVEVIKSEKYSKVITIKRGQKKTVTFPKDLRLLTSTIKNNNPSVATIRNKTFNHITIQGKKKGFSLLTFDLQKKLKGGKKKKVPGSILVRVIDDKVKKRDKDYHVTVGWDDLFHGWVIIANPGPGMDEFGQPIKKKKKGKEVSMLEDWPGQEGVYCSFQASGRNYGAIGDLTIENDTDKPVTVTVPPGLLLDSCDPAVQDLYVADVPTETPCDGADEIDKPITIAPNSSYAITDVPGFCPDGEKDPPTAESGGESIYTVSKPDEKSGVLLDTIAAVKKLNVGNLKLDVFEEDKARSMVCQGALWQVDSQVDEEEGNEFTSQAMSTRFFEAFTASAKPALEKMSAKDRTTAETLVKDDIKKIVAAADLISKQSTKPPAITTSVRN